MKIYRYFFATEDVNVSIPSMDTTPDPLNKAFINVMFFFFLNSKQNRFLLLKKIE